MPGDRIELAEGIVRLVGNATDYQNTLDELEQAVQNHEAKVTSITWKMAQARAEGLKKIADKNNREVRRFQEAGIFGNRTALALEQRRLRVEEERVRFVKEAARFGAQAARRFAAERESREENKGPLIRTRAVQDYLDLKRDQKEEKRNQRLVDAFRFGRAADAVRMARSAQEGLRQAQPMGVAGVAAGVGAIGMVAAASPLAYNTLTESMSLLAATIGRDFTPAIVELSMTVQSAAKWWHNLDSTIKGGIVGMTKFVAIAGAGILALGGVTKAVGAVAAFMTAHPILALLAAGAAGASLLSGLGGAAGGGVPGRIKDADVEAAADLADAPGGLKLVKELRKKNRGGQEEGGMLGSFGPSSFSSLQDFYRKVLLDTTGGSELQAEQLKIQADTRNGVFELVKLAREGKGIVN